MAAPAPSSLSQVCREIADFVKAGVNRESTDETDHSHEHNVERVTIGNPGDLESVKQPDNGSKAQMLNLFFYRFEPFEFDADVLPGQTWMLRTHCLITPFAVTEDNFSAGENDLRLIGEVMRVFHEMPVQIIQVDDNGEDTDFHIQAVFEPLSTDSINQIWSTQGNDVAYRPSVSYEISLAPVLPLDKSVGAPLVAAAGFQVEESMTWAKSDKLGQDYSEAIRIPAIKKQKVDTTSVGWIPAICFLYQNQYTQSHIIAKDQLPANGIGVLLAGEPGTTVTLRWEVWDSTQGWNVHEAIASPPTIVSIKRDTLDPDHPEQVPDETVTLPISSSGQAVLYAIRTYNRASDNTTIQVRSNPLLLTVYEP